MSLIALKNYLQINHKASLIDIANHFNVAPAAMKGMLEHWIRKGKVHCLKGSRCQQGCCCPTDVAYLEIYEWIEK